MNNSEKSPRRLRTKLLAATVSVAVLGGAAGGLATMDANPVRAEAVTVTAPQVTGFADIVEMVSPAVVSVRVKSNIRPASDDSGFNLPGLDSLPGLDNLPKDHPLNRFFRDFRGDRGDREFRRDRRGDGPQRARPTSQGSGFFISEDGIVVTNNHVIDGGSEYMVVMNDGTELDAKLIGTDPRTDLAVLKVDDDRKFKYVDFADEAKVRVGDWVVAVGNPFGLGGTVTAGIISARGRDIGAGPYDDFLQIDAAVNRGNSGGPAFNLEGKVVGVNTAIFSPSGGNVGIAFAIPASTVEQVVADLIDDGNIERGWLGVQIQPVTDDIAESLGLSDDAGALVSEPQSGSPAEKAGIRAGDVITGVDGEAVKSPRELARKIADLDPGKTAEVTIWRNGGSQTVDVELGLLPKPERQASLPDSQGPSADDTLDQFGLTVTPAEDGKGMVVTDVQSGSDAEERGIRAGDTIISVNSGPVNTAEEIETAVDKALEDGRKAVLLQIQRDNNNRFVALPVARG